MPVHDDSPVSVSPDSAIDGTPIVGAPVDVRPSRRSLLEDLNAASDIEPSVSGVGPDDFDRFQDEDRVSSSSGEDGPDPHADPDADGDVGDVGDHDGEDDFDELAILKDDCGRLRAEVQRLRDLNVQKANLLTQKEALLQDSEGRVRKMQQHYEKLVQEQLVSGVGEVRERLSISERQARDQALEIARLQAEVGRVNRLEAEVEEKTTMEAELTALLQEKIQESVALQQQQLALGEQLSRAQEALAAATRQCDRLAADLERTHRWLQNAGLAEEVQNALAGGGEWKAIPLSGDDRRRGSGSLLPEGEAALRQECLTLRQRVKEQAQVEQQLKARFEREVASISQRVAADKAGADPSKDEQLRRVTQENTRLRSLLRDGGAPGSASWASMQAMIDSLQRMVTQQQLHGITSPPAVSPVAGSEGRSPADSLKALVAPPITNLEDEWEISPRPEAATAAPRSQPSSGRGSPIRQTERKAPTGYPRPTPGPTAPMVSSTSRQRLPSFPPRKDPVPAGPGRRSAGPRVPPAARAIRDLTMSPGPTGRESSPSRTSSPHRPGAVSAQGQGGRGVRTSGGSAQSRSISAPQRVPVGPTPAQARALAVARVLEGQRELDTAAATGSPNRLPPMARTMQPPVVPPIGALADGGGGHPMRIGDRSLASVLRRVPLPAPHVSAVPIRHPTPTQLDRKRATSAPHLALAAAPKPLNSPRGANVRAPKISASGRPNL